jgi:hypothetical protein
MDVSDRKERQINTGARLASMSAALTKSKGRNVKGIFGQL